MFIIRGIFEVGRIFGAGQQGHSVLSPDEILVSVSIVECLIPIDCIFLRMSLITLSISKGSLMMTWVVIAVTVVLNGQI